MKDGKVIVVADTEGNVVRVSKNNPEYGNIRVTQERFMMDDTGFLRPRTVSALIAGKVEDLHRLNVSDGQDIDGRIITKHSMKPFNPKDPERDLKIAGETGVPCTLEGQPIYRKSFFQFDPRAQDSERIEHDNGAEIKAKFAEMKADTAIVPGEEFEV